MTRKLLQALAAGMVATTPVFGQLGVEDRVSTAYVDINFYFFAALVAGVLLAVGVQILLTSLSAGFGVSAIGNLDEKVQDRDHSKKTHDHDARESDSNHGTSTLVKISNAWGLWMMVTATISLFLASWMGVTLSMASAPWTGVIVGLTIWAAFYALMAWLDMKLMSTLVGGGISAAVHGLRYSGRALGSMGSMIGGSSPRKEMEKIADHTIEKIRHEIASAMDDNQFQKKLDKYIHELAPPEIDYRRARKEMEHLIGEITLKERDHYGDSEDFDRETFIEIARKHSKVSSLDAEKLGDLWDEVKASHAQGGSISEQAMRTVDQVAGKHGHDAKAIRQRVEEYLRNTEREELDPDALKDDLDRIIRDPSATREIVMNRISQIDRGTVIAALAQRADMDEDRAQKVVGYVEKALSTIKDRAGSTATNLQSRAGAMSDRPENPRPVRSGKRGTVSEEVQARIAKYLNSLQRPELNYRSLKRDFETIFNDPGSTPEVLRNRLAKFDRDTATALLSGNSRISHEQAEHMVDRIMEARDSAIRRSEEIQHQVEAKIKQARDAAVHEAENIRKASATAAWWTFAGALVSAAAAAAAGALAV